MPRRSRNRPPVEGARSAPAGPGVVTVLRAFEDGDELVPAGTTLSASGLGPLLPHLVQRGVVSASPEAAAPPAASVWDPGQSFQFGETESYTSEDEVTENE